MIATGNHGYYKIRCALQHPKGEGYFYLPLWGRWHAKGVTDEEKPFPFASRKSPEILDFCVQLEYNFVR